MGQTIALTIAVALALAGLCSAERVIVPYGAAPVVLEVSADGTLTEPQSRGAKARGKKSAARPVTLTGRVSVRLRAGIDGAAFLKAHGLTTSKQLTWAENSWVITTPAGAANALEIARGLSELPEVLEASPILLRPGAARFVPNDTIFEDQWHLLNNGDFFGSIAGNDANVVPAWDAYTGAGVNIGIVDIGVELDHPDLAANNVMALNIDVWDNDPDPSPEPGLSHGTKVAGIAAALGNNEIGVCGTAFGARFAAIRYYYDIGADDAQAAALAHTITATEPEAQIHVSNNSYGPVDDGTRLEAPGPLTQAALEAGVTQGRNGKGTIFIWAAGNGRLSGDDTNYDGFASSPYVIAVTATGPAGIPTDESEAGASILVNAPSGDQAKGLATTTTGNSYTLTFGGTSGAAPVAAGVVALMLEANSELTWRDVAHVLVDSAAKNDPLNPDWITNGAGRTYHRDFGFGRVDAAAATALAAGWTNVPPLAAPLTAAGEVNLAVPDNDSTGVTAQLEVDAPAGFVTERVIVRVTAEHEYRGDLKWTLSSPQGTEILLAGARNDEGTEYIDWPFASVASWGEDPDGVWTLKVQDAGPQDTGTFTRWSIEVIGSLPGGEGEDGVQTADRNADFVIDLDELLRVIQIYNTLGYHCAEVGEESEDEYIPGPGANTTCVPHDTDYAPQDWVISLDELLRVIQFYNSLGYHHCPGEGTEDGFCPGAV